MMSPKNQRSTYPLQHERTSNMMRAEASSLNSLADKVESAMSDDEVAKIGQKIYDTWTQAGLTKQDFEAILTPERTIDYKKIEELIERKSLKQSPLELTSLAASSLGFQSGLTMKPHELKQEIKTTQDEIKVMKSMMAEPTGFGGGQPAPGTSKEDMHKLLADKGLALRNIQKDRDVKVETLAKRYGGTTHMVPIGGISRLQGLEILLAAQKGMQQLSPQTYNEAMAVLRYEPNVFVFSDSVLDTLLEDLAAPEAAVPEILDLPFRTCLVEGYGVINKQYCSLIVAANIGEHGKIEPTKDKTGKVAISVPVILIHEVTAAHYEILGVTNLAEMHNPRDLTMFPFMVTLKDGYFVNFRPTSGVFTDQELVAISVRAVRQVIHRLTNLEGFQSGTARTNIRAKVKSNGQTYFHKIKHVVYLGLKKEYNRVASVQGESVDWSHRWEVRGHWRKVRGIGKDREGNYTVKGFAWVVPHIKGPDALPVIKKVRADMPTKENL